MAQQTCGATPMADDKPNGNADLLVQAIRRVHREQVEDKNVPDHQPIAPVNEIETKTERQ